MTNVQYYVETQDIKKYGSILYQTGDGDVNLPRKTEFQGKLKIDIPPNTLTMNEAIEDVLSGGVNQLILDLLDYGNVNASVAYVELNSEPKMEDGMAHIDIKAFAFVSDKVVEYDVSPKILDLLFLIFEASTNSVMNHKFSSAQDVLDVLIENDPNILEHLSGIPVPEDMTQEQLHLHLDTYMRERQSKTLSNWIELL